MRREMNRDLIKNFGLAFIFISVMFSACKEESNTYWDELKQAEIEAREAYIESEGITTEPTESGLYYIETEEGTGVQAVAGSVVHVAYQGEFLNTQVFDASMPDKAPIRFTLGTGAVIAGWDEAIAFMKEGGKAKLVIPSDLAYGVTGSGSVPPYTTLVFYVELVDVE